MDVVIARIDLAYDAFKGNDNFARLSEGEELRAIATLLQDAGGNSGT